MEMAEERLREISNIIADHVAHGLAITCAVIFLYLFDPPLWVMWVYVPLNVVVGSVIGIWKRKSMTPEPTGKTAENFKRV